MTRTPVLVFMHIAKTAGTYVNEVFLRHFGADAVRIHVESNLAEVASELIADGDGRIRFVSGHVPYPELKRKLTPIEAAYATCLREPIAQLISHMQWIKFIGQPGNEDFRDLHRTGLADLATRLFPIDFDDVTALEDLMADPEARFFFDNCQTRYLVEGPPDRYMDASDLWRADAALAEFDFVATTGHVGPCAERLIAYAGGGKFVAPAEIINPSRVSGRPNLEIPVVRRFYEALTAWDRILYQRAVERSNALLHAS